MFNLFCESDESESEELFLFSIFCDGFISLFFRFEESESEQEDSFFGKFFFFFLSSEDESEFEED